MRRLGLVAVIAVLAVACATPPIRLSPVFATGTQRTYRLESTTRNVIDVPGSERVEHTTLVATSTIDVLGPEGTSTRVRLTLTPERFERDGRVEEREAQTVEMLVGTDGRVESIERIGGVPASITTDAEDLAPLLGAPLPSERLRLGDRWERTLPGFSLAGDIRQSGLIDSFRVVRGFDTVIARVGTERPLIRERTVGDQTLALRGTEFASSELAFAFREGFPVLIETTAHGRFDLLAGDVTGGTVEVRSTSVLTLLEEGPRA